LDEKILPGVKVFGAIGTFGRESHLIRLGIVWGASMKDLNSMSIDELWSLHEQVASTLARKIAAEKTKLEERLHRLGALPNALGLHRPRRPYPKVLPKYQNPKNPAEKWSGRGKQPHWVKAQLKSGKKLEGFLITR
jgi:DNA-binding protein H-NS